jgi:hypothetical protein
MLTYADSRTLSAYLDMLWAMHNLIQVLTAYATVIPRPLVVTKDRLVGMDYVQAEIGKVRMLMFARRMLTYAEVWTALSAWTTSRPRSARCVC